MEDKSKSEKGILKYWTEAFKNDYLYKDQYELESSINLVSPQRALDNLKEKDWRKVRQGCEQISIYAKNYPSQIQERKTAVLKAALHHIENYSVISRHAVHTLRDMINNIENFTDEEWEQIFSAFLLYYGVAPSKYMMDLVEETLKYIIGKISYQTSALILTSTNEKLKHKKSKELAAKLLKKVVVELGPYNILTESNSLGPSILKTAAKLLTLQSDATRYYGKKILYSLMMSQAFERFLIKHIPPNLKEVTNDVVNDIRTKGVKQKFKQA